MNKLIFFVSVLGLSIHSAALNLQTVFDNQKKAAFPDTCELQMRTSVTFPGMPSQTMETTVVAAGELKSVTTIKSSSVQMKTVRNGSRVKVTDLKTGQALPAQNAPDQNSADVNKQMGSPEDYNRPVAEGDLWKITPKDSSKPALYYSEKQRRIVKTVVPVNGATATSEFEYCANSCQLPGTLKKVTIKTVAPQGGESTVVLEVLKVKQRRVLPMKMFDVE